jgi:hypothetical protein
MSTTIDYYFDLQNIENVDIVKLFKSIIDNNLNNIPYELQILNEDEIKLLEMRGGAEGDTTIPYILFQQLMDYLTNTQRETEETQQSIYDRMFNPTSVTKEEEPSEIIKEEQPPMPVEEQPPMPVEQQPYIQPEQQPYIQPEQQPYVSPEQQPYVSPEQQPYVQPEQHPYVQPEQQPYVPLEQQPYVPPEQQPYVPPEQQPYVPPQQQPIMPPQQQPIMPLEKQQYLPPQPQQLIGGNILMKTILKIRLTFKKEYSLQLTFLKKLRYNK